MLLGVHELVGVAAVGAEVNQRGGLFGIGEVTNAVEEGEAMFPVIGRGAGEGRELGDRLAERRDELHPEQPGEADRERKHDAEPDGQELRAHRDSQRGVPDRGGDDPEPIPEEGEEPGGKRAHDERGALNPVLLGRLFCGHGHGDRQVRFGRSPRKSLVRENHTARPGADEDAEIGGHPQEQGHLPPGGVEANVSAVEDVLDVVESGHGHDRETDAAHRSRHCLHDVHLDPELPPVLRVAAEPHRDDEHSAHRQVDRHSHLQRSVRAGRRRQSAYDETEQDQAPAEVACLQFRFQFCQFFSQHAAPPGACPRL